MEFRSAARIAVPALLVGAVAAIFLSPLGDWLTVARLAESRDTLAALVAGHPFVYAEIFLLLCIVASALCFPVAPLIGVAAGALFGFWTGLGLLSLGITIGSTFAFLASRHLFRASVQARLGRRLAAIDRGFARHGGAYLLALRINPLIPYWLVNLAMGVTVMRMRCYVPLTFLGLLPALIIYANAGAALAAARGASDIVSPTLVASLLLLSLLPLIADRIVSRRAAGSGLPKSGRLI